MNPKVASTTQSKTSAKASGGAKVSGKRTNARAARKADRNPPDFDPLATGRVVGRVEIRDVQLVGTYFELPGVAPLPEDEIPNVEPDSGIDVEWAISDDRALLGCLLTFGAVFDDADNHPDPYRLIGRFRITYSVTPGESLANEDVNQFAHWNAMFNVWPYWRELVASITTRAGFPKVTIPVMRVPTPAYKPE